MFRKETLPSELIQYYPSQEPTNYLRDITAINHKGTTLIYFLDSFIVFFISRLFLFVDSILFQSQ